jgi:hypothetical protein
MNLKNVLLLSVAVLIFSAPAFAQETPSLSASPGGPGKPAPAIEPVEPIDSTFVPVVESKTEALQVVSVTRRGYQLRIRLKNTSDKNIYSFRMSYNKEGTSLFVSYIMGDGKQALAPGEVYKYDFQLVSNPVIARQPLTFQAVLFEDGTGDGETDKVKSLQDLFMANKRQLKSIIGLLEASIASPNVETFEVLEELEKQISGLPNYLDGLSLAGLAGLMLPSWKEGALYYIRDMKRLRQEGAEVKFQEELGKVIDRFNKTLARYPGESGASTNQDINP